MTLKIQFSVRLLPLVLLAFEGCSPPVRPPVNLARQIAGADTAILWDWAHFDHISITGKEARDLVRAVSSSAGGHRSYRASYRRTIEFYSGTNFLTTIRWQANVFKTSEGEFKDESGVLEALHRRIRGDAAAKENGVREIAAIVVAEPGLAGLQAWGETVLWQHETENFKTNFFKNSTELVPEAVPDWLKSAWPRPPEAIYISEGSDGEIKCLVLEWPGSCGLAIGPTNFALSASWDVKYLTRVVPGIYAYHD